MRKLVGLQGLHAAGKLPTSRSHRRCQPASPPPQPPRLFRWVPGTAKFVALGCHARGTGALQLWELDGADLSQVAAEEPSASLKCACFGAGTGSATSQQLLALGNFAGQLQLVDVERLGSGSNSSGSGSSSAVFSVQAHAGIVNAVDACSGSQVGAGRFGGASCWVPATDPGRGVIPAACLPPLHKP